MDPAGLDPADLAPVDVVVVGAGPNGLAAAVTFARAGLEVVVLEAQPTAGGGARTLDLGLAPGIRHDVCSAVHPLAWASPFFAAFDLARHGVELRTPEVSYAQPLPGGRAGLAWHDLDATVDGLGADGDAWRALLGPLVRRHEDTVRVGLGDKRSVPAGLLPGGLPTALRFALRLVEQSTPAWDLRFADDVAAALITGVAAHAVAPMPSVAGAGVGLVLAALAHTGGGWPIPRGGSQSITDALVADLVAHGGRVVTGRPVRSAADLPRARVVLLDTVPATAVDVLGDRIAPRVRRSLERYRHGAGVAKVDLVLSGPVPWAAEGVGRAGTVHVGGTRAEMVAAEAAVAAGRHAEAPMCLVSDPTVVDPDRAQGGLRPLWAYTHVPAGSTLDMTDAVVGQIERFAPGFRDVVVGARCVPAARLAEHNANLVGGDIGAGALGLRQLLARPTAALDPYHLGPGVYLGSAATPPGPGVHGLCGWFAARSALRREFGIRVRDVLG